MCVIEVRNLTKFFGGGETAVQALRGVDLAVRKGEFVVIMGPSGSGKSTLLSLLGGMDTPTEGRVLIEGKDLAAMSDDERTLARRRQVGFVFQAFNLLPTLTAEENVALPLELDGVSAQDARQRASTVLEWVNMLHRRNHLPSQLSGGEQQRVAVARAMVIEPALLLADEPTGNLDSKSSQHLMQLLDDLVQDRQQTIVMVTHDPTAAAHASRSIHLLDGLIDGDEETSRGAERRLEVHGQ
jgi:putative ABC transport system ATP-binding protein